MIYIIIYIVWLESESDTGYSGKHATAHGLRGFQRTPDSLRVPGYGVYRGMKMSELNLFSSR
jgi:hypothetical protein